MLILSRRKNESIVHNYDVTITVVDIRGDKVRLGIVAPPECPVHRPEVYDAICGTVPPALPPRSPEEIPFLQAIQENPDDEGIRLVFADWLEERADPLGDLIRTQCQLAKLPPTDNRRHALEVRDGILWAEHGRAWRPSLPAVLFLPSGGHRR
jgi:carbon storage regulator